MSDGTDDGPISVPYQEPSDEDKAHMDAEAALGDQITAARDSLNQTLNWLVSQVDNLPNPLPVGGLEGLVGELQGVVSTAQTATQGLHDGTYALNAFHQVVGEAHQAISACQSSANLDNDTDLNAAREQVRNAIVGCISSLSGG
jgi:hypothetical protein